MAALNVAAPAFTLAIGYHPGVQFVPDLIYTFAPTSPATKVYVALVTTGLFPVQLVPARSVTIFAFAGLNPPPLRFPEVAVLRQSHTVVDARAIIYSNPCHVNAKRAAYASSTSAHVT